MNYRLCWTSLTESQLSTNHNCGQPTSLFAAPVRAGYAVSVCPPGSWPGAPQAVAPELLASHSGLAIPAQNVGG